MTNHQSVNVKLALLSMIVFALVAVALYGQQPGPSLSTSDKVAISTLEKSKQEAQKQYQDAQQNELNILREWMSSHPGYKIDPQTFAIEKDAPAPTPKTTEKPAAPKPTGK